MACRIFEISWQKSINNLVDISNFMLLEIGHPTHVFDLKKLAKPAIKVSWAKKVKNLMLWMKKHMN